MICLYKSLPETPSFNMWHYTYTIIHTQICIYSNIYTRIWSIHDFPDIYCLIDILRAAPKVLMGFNDSMMTLLTPLAGTQLARAFRVFRGRMQHHAAPETGRFWWRLKPSINMENGWNMAQIWIDVSEKMENHSKLLNYQRVPQFYGVLWYSMAIYDQKN